MELERLPPELLSALAGEGFRRHRRLIVPLLTTDPQGYPRAALLTLGELRALSPTELTVAVLAGSRTAANLIRRQRATVLYLHQRIAASVQARAGRARLSVSHPGRQLFPLRISRVRLDEPASGEEEAWILAGPRFGASGRATTLFSEELFEELGRGPRPA